MELHLFAGMPGSGKTTQRYAFLQGKAGRAVVFSPDELLIQDGKYIWTPQLAAAAWRDTYHALGEWLGRKTGIAVFDATMLDPLSRSALVNITRGAGAWTHIHWMKTPIEVCIQRNGRREDGRRVPDATMGRMWASMMQPTNEEGFDVVEIHPGV